MKPGKSPGHDCFTTQYYKKFLPQLSGPFLSTFNVLPEATTQPTSLLEAHIVVLPKGDRDPTIVSNYRPISLLNVDIKLYAKILANRLSTLLPSWISLDQVGFVPGREARDNTLRALNIHYWLTNSNPGLLFIP